MQENTGPSIIRLYGDQILKETCKEVGINENINEILTYMITSLYYYKGVGLAANQIGHNKRIIVIDHKWIETKKKYKHLNIFINPEIIDESIEDEVMQESCLSIPNIDGIVYRPVNITVKYYDIHFKEKIKEFTGMESRIIQHEIDHLNGVLFTDRLSKEQKNNILPLLNRLKKERQL